MPLFHSKPTTVEAVQWTGENLAHVQRLLGHNVTLIDVSDPHIIGGRGLHIVQAGCIATPRDWIVKGNGQPTVVDEARFAATYAPVIEHRINMSVSPESAKRLASELAR